MTATIAAAALFGDPAGKRQCDCECCEERDCCLDIPVVWQLELAGHRYVTDRYLLLEEQLVDGDLVAQGFEVRPLDRHQPGTLEAVVAESPSTTPVTEKCLKAAHVRIAQALDAVVTPTSHDGTFHIQRDGQVIGLVTRRKGDDAVAWPTQGATP